MTILQLEDDDAFAVRFAISPLWETNAAVRAASTAHGKAALEPWQRRIAKGMRRANLESLITIKQLRYTPDFLCPTPLGPRANITDELARVRETPTSVAAAELFRAADLAAGAHEVRMITELANSPSGITQQVADALERAWQHLVEPFWPSIQEVLEADVAYHARRIAESGLAGLFGRLDHTVSLAGRKLEVSDGRSDRRSLRGAGLLLVPSVFNWPSVCLILEEPWQPTLVYPARGLGALWCRSSPPAEATLGKLIGHTRAGILTATMTPATTTLLARKLNLSIAAVSSHLKVLREARLVHARRDQHRVYYKCTASGYALLGSQT